MPKILIIDDDPAILEGLRRLLTRSGYETVVAPILEKLGYELHRAKTNVGLGRVTNPDAIAEQKVPTGAAK